MKRTSPFFTLPGIVLTIIFLVGLALFAWFNGGKAFSPGSLSSQGQPDSLRNGFGSHQEFEKQCRLCHAPLQSEQATLCLDCHSEVSEQIQNKQGTHSLVEPASPCYRCHTEHKGQDYNILKPGLELFNHDQTGFSLIWHQLDYAAAQMDCADCHALELGFALDQSHCTSCHAADDPAFMLKHTRDFGNDCLVCHDGVDRMADFEHSQTDFPLAGKHAEATCADCHADRGATLVGTERFTSALPECVTCHETGHKGLFGNDCAECHDANAWKPAAWEGQPFDHAAASFSLDHHQRDSQGSLMPCSACHGQDVAQDVLPSCRDCHGQGPAGTEFIRKHDEQFGPACLDCHDGIDRMSDFDHASVFPLDGRHVDLECQECHIERIFIGTPQKCFECHAEPQIHQGVFGTECQDCHTSQGWIPAQLHNHSFPLNHGESGQVACQTCHPASYVEYTCYGCHEHDPAETERKHLEENISPAELPNCSECHPTGLQEESGDD